MAYGDGKIRQSFDVHCAICERPALGLAFGKTKKAAGQELRKQGWREHTSLGWICCSTPPVNAMGNKTGGEL